MPIIHVFSFGKVLLHITSIFNPLELINNIKILEKYSPSVIESLYNILYIM